MRESAETFNRVADHLIQVQGAGRRPGDVVCVYTRVERAERLLGWRAQRDLTEGIQHSLQWPALRDEVPSGRADSLMQR